MKHFLIVTVCHENEVPTEFLQKVVSLFDKKGKVNLESDDHVTIFPETKKGKSVTVHLYYESKDFKSAVYEILVKANVIGQGWAVTGPFKVKKNMFVLNLDKAHCLTLPDDINELTIMLNNNMI